MTGIGLQLVDLMPVDAAMQVEQLAGSGALLEVVGSQRRSRIWMLELLVGLLGHDRRFCALEERGHEALAFIDSRGPRWNVAALTGPLGSSTSLYDTLARFGNEVVLADAPTGLVLDGLRTAAEVGCSLWVGVEHQATLPAAALVLEVGDDESCTRVWTPDAGELFSV